MQYTKEELSDVHNALHYSLLMMVQKKGDRTVVMMGYLMAHLTVLVLGQGLVSCLGMTWDYLTAYRRGSRLDIDSDLMMAENVKTSIETCYIVVVFINSQSKSCDIF